MGLVDLDRLRQKQRNNEDFPLFSFCNIKMTIMTSYFRIRDDANEIFKNFTRFLPIVYSYQVSESPDFNQKKKLRKFGSLIIFLAKHSL